MPGHKRLAAALAVVAAAVAISACGSSDADRTISPTDADRLQTALAQVEGAVNQGNCPRAEREAEDFLAIVNGLPETVGTENKEALRAAGENLQKLAADPGKCVQTGTTDLTDETTTEEPTTTTPTTTPTTTATTTTEDTTTTTTAPPSDTGGGDTGGPPGTPPGGSGGPPPDTGGGGDTGGGTGGGTGGTGTGGTGTGGTG
jgi:hypothetical protein